MNILFSPRVRTVSSRVIGFTLAIILALSSSEWHFQSSFIEHILWFFGWLFVGIGVMGRIWCSLYISGFKNAKLVFAQPFIENPASQIERNNLGNEQTDFRRYKHRNVGQLYLTYDNSEFFHFGINKEIMGSRKIKCNFDPILKCIKEEGSVLF